MIAEFWDKKFSGEEYRYGQEPNAFLAQEAAKWWPKGASILAVGDGEGRNGVWLAGQEYITSSIEPSGKGVEKAQALAKQVGVTLESFQGLFPTDLPGTKLYDGLVMTYVHTTAELRPGLHRGVGTRLKAGGTLIFEAFSSEQLQYKSGGPRNPDMLFNEEMLRKDFADLNILHLSKEIVHLDQGPAHQGPASVIRLIAQKPQP